MEEIEKQSILAQEGKEKIKIDLNNNKIINIKPIV